MVNSTDRILIVNIVTLFIFVILSCIYLLTIAFIPRLHTTRNILTGNFCLAGLICGLFWIVWNSLAVAHTSILLHPVIPCTVFKIAQVMINSSVVYALTMISINRFLTLSYPQVRLLRRRTWALISCVVQWIVAMVLPIHELIVVIEVNIAFQLTSYVLPIDLFLVLQEKRRNALSNHLLSSLHRGHLALDPQWSIQCLNLSSSPFIDPSCSFCEDDSKSCCQTHIARCARYSSAQAYAF